MNEFYEKCNSRATYKPQRAEEERLQKEEFKAIMHWKLGFGNINKIIKGESPHPCKEKVATSSDWKTEPMPESAEEISIIKLAIPISYKEMAVLQKGHIPQEQEDHWFMYCDGEYIRYYRSWSGKCAFVAHYHKEEGCYIIDELTINRALAEFGVNGTEAGAWLFRYLITAETGGDEAGAWQDYINAWDGLDRLYNKS